MNRRIELSPPRAADALGTWFRAQKADLLARLGAGDADAKDERRSDRTWHSMEGGRDLPPNSPFSDHDATRSRSDDVDFTVRVDVARWNPREVSNAMLVVDAKHTNGARFVCRGQAQDTDLLDHLDAEITGLPDPAAFLDALVKGLGS